MKSNFRKRLDILEEHLSGKEFIVIYKGVLPYVVQVQSPGRSSSKNILHLTSDKQVEEYMHSLPKSVIVM